MVRLDLRSIIRPAALILLQLIAATYFVIDGIDDLVEQARKGFRLDLAMECLVALALLSGLLLSARYFLAMVRELRRKEQSLVRARGALADHIAQRFGEWKLTPSEADVALFSLKGCDVSEIARLRGAAAGTVRSQLSQVYAKAGVASQSALLAVFIEDLLEANHD